MTTKDNKAAKRRREMMRWYWLVLALTPVVSIAGALHCYTTQMVAAFFMAAAAIRVLYLSTDWKEFWK